MHGTGPSPAGVHTLRPMAVGPFSRDHGDSDGLTLPASKVSPLPDGGPFLRSAIFPVESCAQRSFHVLTVGGLTRTR